MAAVFSAFLNVNDAKRVSDLVEKLLETCVVFEGGFGADQHKDSVRGQQARGSLDERVFRASPSTFFHGKRRVPMAQR